MKDRQDAVDDVEILPKVTNQDIPLKRDYTHASFLKNNRSVLIFPHGTRTPPNTINKIQSGVVILYKHLNIKVVPIKLNSGKYWGKNSFLKYPGKIIVEFLKPIKPGLSPGEFRKRLEKLL